MPQAANVTRPPSETGPSSSPFCPSMSPTSLRAQESDASLPGPTDLPVLGDSCWTVAMEVQQIDQIIR